MRLLTHNMLVCNVKACVETATRTADGTVNFPLKIIVAEGGMEMVESEFNAAKIVHLLPKLEWSALKSTASDLGVAELPDAIPESPESDEEFLRSVHTLIMDLHIKEGALVCPHCSRQYPITKGIPNMILKEDEL